MKTSARTQSRRRLFLIFIPAIIIGYLIIHTTGNTLNSAQFLGMILAAGGALGVVIEMDK